MDTVSDIDQNWDGSSFGTGTEWESEGGHRWWEWLGSEDERQAALNSDGIKKETISE